MNRRSFLKTGTLAISSGAALLTVGPQSFAREIPINEKDYTKFLDPNANLRTLTEAAKKMVDRDQLLASVLEKIPSAERAEQIFNVISRHIVAEEKGDVEETMATLSKDPIFESLPEGKIFSGHQSVAEDYANRYHGLTRRLHITNLSIDAKGAYAEMLWEGRQKGTYKGLKPVKDPKRFFIPMIVYYEVSEQGLIQRESVYYDQYLGALSLEILPDVLQNKLQLLALNPKLICRRG